MAHYNFKRDLEDSQKAVDIVLGHLIDRGYTAHELEGKTEQKYGDIRYYRSDEPVNVEVKYDLMSRKTGNLCFEMSNGRGPTGIMKTKANLVVYICPAEVGHVGYVFKIDKLKEYICRIGNTSVQIKNGGDRRSFTLALVKIDTIISDEIVSEIWNFENAQLPI